MSRIWALQCLILLRNYTWTSCRGPGHQSMVLKQTFLNKIFLFHHFELIDKAISKISFAFEVFFFKKKVAYVTFPYHQVFLRPTFMLLEIDKLYPLPVIWWLKLYKQVFQIVMCKQQIRSSHSANITGPQHFLGHSEDVSKVTPQICRRSGHGGQKK